MNPTSERPGSEIEPRVGLLITTYNSGKKIGEVIESLMLQKEAAWERVRVAYIMDGGSTDETMSVIHRMWRLPVELEIVRNTERRGEYFDVNVGLTRLAQSGFHWALRLHDDNPMKRNWLETMIERIRVSTPDIATICSSYDVLYDRGKIEKGENSLHLDRVLVPGGPQSVMDSLKNGCWWHNCGSAMNLRAFTDIGRFDDRLRQVSDWEWLVRCLSMGWKVEYIPRSLFIYKCNDATQSSANFRKDIDIGERISVLGRYVKYVDRKSVRSFFGRELRYVFRRLARAVVSLDSEQVAIRVRTIGQVTRSFHAVMKEKRATGQ
jgi:GT2 family glycosyltransferase